MTEELSIERLGMLKVYHARINGQHYKLTDDFCDEGFLEWCRLEVWKLEPDKQGVTRGRWVPYDSKELIHAIRDEFSW